MPPARKIAVVTGAARGLGRAIALRLADDVHGVAVWDLNLEGAEETAELIRARGKIAVAMQCNSSIAGEIDAAMQRTRAELGQVTILVNNAALSPFCPFEDLTESAWDDLMAINLKGPFLCCKAVIADMLQAGWGRIINISSS